MKLLSVLIFIAALITAGLANTEKLILEARADKVQETCDTQSDLLSLTPPYTKTRQSLIPYSTINKSSSQWFQLDDLKDGSNYEIRISYPAIVRSPRHVFFVI